MIRHLLTVNIRKILGFLQQLLVFLVLFAILTSVIDWWRGRDLPKKAIPLFQANTIDGKTIDLQALSQDQVVVVYFWASWCGPCRLTSPSVSHLSRFYPVVSVAMSSGSNLELANYATKHRYAFDVINDNNHTIARLWSVPATPVILFIKDGEVVNHTIGASFLPGLLWRAFWA